MSQFQMYLELGFHHILDFDGRDHILFIIAMMCLYKLKDWKEILAIVTSFTVAHSLSLLLSVLNIVSVNGKLIELAIAVTILFTCVENIFLKKLQGKRVLFSGIFGLVHGLGFSNYLKSLLGKSGDLFTPLLAFNIGVELGQLLLVVLLFICMWMSYRFLKMNQQSFILITSILIGIQSVYWVIERL